MQICTSENILAEKNALERLAEQTNNDFRQCITTLEVVAKTSKKITMEVVTASKAGKDVNVMMNFFEASSRLLSGRDLQSMSFREKMDLYFVDYDLIPLTIFENALNAFNSTGKIQEFSRLAEASELMAFGDVINTNIRKNQNWSLLKDYGIISTVGACT